MIDKELALSILKTLSSLEALALSITSRPIVAILPDYLHEEMTNQINKLTEIVLGN